MNTIESLLRDGRVDKDATKEIYFIYEDKSPEIIQELKGGMLLADGQMYMLVYLDGTKELVVGNSADDYMNAFKLSGEGGSGSGVQSISGDGVTGSPQNPVITYPTPEQIGAVTEEVLQELKDDFPELNLNDFLVGGENGNEGRTLNPTDVGYTTGGGSRVVTHEGGSFQNSRLISSDPTNSSVVYRTGTGTGKFSPATAPDEAVVLAQLDSSLENKVDTEVGKGLSEENFTTDEKLKLAGLENPKFQGQFLSLADLNTADVGGIGNYAYVDGGAGNPVDLYIWDDTNGAWEVVAGESTMETPESIKVKYESNPDTNAFTDSEKSKLASMTSLFTSSLKTIYDNAVSWITNNGQSLIDHLSDFSNPHQVTKSQVGLSNVDNTSDLEKPLSNPVKQILEDNRVTPLLSRTTVNKTLVLDYEDRTEYIERITVNGYSITAQTFRTYTTTHRFPTGIRISSADTLNISNTSSSTSTTLAVDQNANGDIIFRLANYSTANLSLNMTVFIKAVFYK